MSQAATMGEKSIEGKPFFSIIIPVYNVAPYLRECLDSVLAQTFKDWECICVDDGSTDGSGEILDEYAEKDARIRVLHQGNAGVSLARELGLSKAIGNYVVWVDPDDWIDSCHLFSIWNIAKSNEIDFIWSNLVIEGESRHEIIYQKSAETATAFFQNLLTAKVMGGMPTRAYRRAFIQGSGADFSHGKLKIMEDIYFLCKFLSANPIVAYIDNATYHYRFRQGSLSNMGGTLEWWQWAMDAVDTIYKSLDLRLSKDLREYRVARLKYMMLRERNITNDMFCSYHPEIKVLPRDIAPILWRICFTLAACRMRNLVLITVGALVWLKQVFRSKNSRNLESK